MNLTQIEKIAKALADKTRLKIYVQIAAGSQASCSQLVERRSVTPATISHHLKILSEAGLIECRREGQFVLNQVKPAALDDFAKSVKALARTHRQ